jgi:hypothetical protein
MIAIISFMRAPFFMDVHLLYEAAPTADGAVAHSLFKNRAESAPMAGKSRFRPAGTDQR